jgi:pimeloyl-ACP methyl ester carboxylesterase
LALSFTNAVTLRVPHGMGATGSPELLPLPALVGVWLPLVTYWVGVQTLVIRGEQDKYLLTSNLNGLEQYVLELTIKRIGDGPHWVLHEQPALVNASIQEFIY